MTLLLLSSLAGILTVAAPCILPLLPVIVGGSLVEGKQTTKSWKRPLIITSSLALSVIVFTLLLKATTSFLGVPQAVWQVISGGIIILLGLHFVYPGLWDSISIRFNLLGKAHSNLGKAEHKRGNAGAVLTGFALGPVFSSCSPTYALIVATVLPVSFIEGLGYLIAYALGLSATLLLIAFGGQAVLTKLRWASNPDGWFRRIIGLLFLLTGLAVMLGWDKDLQAFVLENGWYDPISDLEVRLR